MEQNRAVIRSAAAVPIISDWEVDGVADNTWSSLEEVAWIECESNGEHIEPQPGTLRGSSCTSIESIQIRTGESTKHDQKLPDQVYQRLNKSNASPKSETFKDHNHQESGYSANGRITSSDWYDNTPGSSHSVHPSNALDKSSSALRGVNEVESKKETSKYTFEGADMCKGGSSYNEDGADIVNSSCHFLLSDMCPPGGDLEFLAEVQEEVRRDNLLEFGWGNSNNLEDMNKLFSSNDSILSQGYDNTTGMLWEPPSPTLGASLESLREPATIAVSPEFVTRGVAKDLEAKAEVLMSKLETFPVSEEWRGSSDEKQYVPPLDDPCLPMQVDSCTDCSNGSNWESQGASAGRTRGSKCMENEGFHGLNEANKVSKTVHFGLSRSEDDDIHAVQESAKWKTSKGRRHGSRSKRLEGNVQKTASSGTKAALNLGQTNSTPLMYVPVVPIVQESSPASAQVSRVSLCEPISPMQCLQPVPYVHAGFGFPTHHHLPVVVPTPSVLPQQLQPQGQPVFISYQPPFIDAPRLQPSKGTFDASSSQSPTASSTMTPQEKIEKLRWRQKMQARLAVEQQQQQLMNQRLIPEQPQFGRPIHSQPNKGEEVVGGSVRLTQSQCAEPFNWNDRSLCVEGAMIDDGDESLAATVLNQLLNITSKMDTRTRLCLRDGFCRLARNAMQRRAAGDSRGSSKKRSSELIDRSCMAESSSSSEQPCSQRLLTVDDIVETETNPMDRFIAHLLFHKRFPSSYTPLHTNDTPCNNSDSSEPGALHQNGWAWNEPNQLSHHSPTTRSSSVTGEVVLSKGVDMATSDIMMCEKAKIPSACPSQRIVSGRQLEKVLNFSAVSADTNLQHLVEREAGMADMDPSIAPSTGNMDFSDEVAKPLLQAK